MRAGQEPRRHWAASDAPAGLAAPAIDGDAIASGALALFVVLAYGALGAVSPRRRWGRLIVVAALALLLASITSVTTCRGGPFLPTTPSP
jgi:hypothetical protein